MTTVTVILGVIVSVAVVIGGIVVYLRQRPDVLPDPDPFARRSAFDDVSNKRTR